MKQRSIEGPSRVDGQELETALRRERTYWALTNTTLPQDPLLIYRKTGKVVQETKY